MIIGTYTLQEPKTVVLGTVRKPKGTSTKRRCVEVKETMLYIPILDTLNILLQNETVISEVYMYLIQSLECTCTHDYCTVFTSTNLYIRTCTCTHAGFHTGFFSRGGKKFVGHSTCARWHAAHELQRKITVLLYKCCTEPFTFQTIQVVYIIM